MTPYVNIHTHHKGEGINLIDIGENYREFDIIRKSLGDPETTFFSAGIHPMAIGKLTPTTLLDEFEPLLSRPEIVAIGECGLDRRSEIRMESQEMFFFTLASVAEKLGKPVLIHCVRAHSDLIAIAKEFQPTVPWIVHGYNNNEQILKQLLAHGFYISLGAALCRPDSRIAMLIGNIPQDRLFLETDDGDIPIREVYARAADLLGMGERQLRELMLRNFNRTIRQRVNES